MLRRIKLGLLAAANGSGLSWLIGNSRWRQQRLLILCYHGITDGDLHQWNPFMFMQAEEFKTRMELLRSTNCSVLGLNEALERLEEGSLPPRSVVLTFDDGFADFYRVAWPTLRELDLPATVYVTTYYALRNLPVFDPTLSYLLWKGRGQQLHWPDIMDAPVFLNQAGCLRMDHVLRTVASKKNLTATQKDRLLEELASRLGVDYEAFRRSRVLNLINANEARRLSAEGADLQLHTHRHRTSFQQDQFEKEIVDNRNCMTAIGLGHPEHFCYPNGLRGPNHAQWLDELGIKSATTSELGLVELGADRHSLPRVTDCFPFNETEFLGWVYGTAPLLPRRRPQGTATAPEGEDQVETRPLAPAVNQ